MGEHNAKVNGIKLEGSMGLIILLLAIFICPGWSTVFAGFMQKDEDAKKSAIIIGIVQVLLIFVLVGWIWAIMSAFKIYNNSK